MDRGARRATVHEVTRVGHNLVTKPPPPNINTFPELIKGEIQGKGDMGLVPGWGRCPGEGNGNPLQYYCLGNPTDGGAWQATVHGVTESDTT